jgi:transcriptional regulator with XRE-family HTH domain
MQVDKDIATRYTPGMKFKSLQENLRKTLLERIGEGELTGLRLADQIGFKQAHISNFLNRKRGLSLEAMDRVLNVQHLSVLDLLDPGEINKRASIPPPSEDEFENVFVVDGAVAATQPLIMSMKVRDIEKYKRSFLRKLRADVHGKRREWERFVAIRADADAISMYPRVLPGATVLIDRHYTVLQSYRRGESNIFAVFVDGLCKLRYVEAAGDNLVFRPHNQSYGVQIVSLEKGQTAAEYVIGRVCYVGMEM